MPVDRKRASNTTLARAGDCTLGGERTGAWDAIEWRREVLEVGHCADGG